MTTRKFRSIMLITLPLILLLGLYGSLKILFHNFLIESDFSDSAMLWFGFHEHGWIFFKKWIYTSDNWLLSLIPIHFFLIQSFWHEAYSCFTHGLMMFMAEFLRAMKLFLSTAP